jgi:hypothetical protein
MKWLTKPWLPWLGLAGLTFVAYSPALNGGFVWDDVIIYMLAQKSLSYFWTSPYQPDYWPVTYSVLFVLWNVFHANTWGYHLANLGLHLVNVGLWSVILRQLQLVHLPAQDASGDDLLPGEPRVVPRLSGPPPAAQRRPFAGQRVPGALRQDLDGDAAGHAGPGRAGPTRA